MPFMFVRRLGGGQVAKKAAKAAAKAAKKALTLRSYIGQTLPLARDAEESKRTRTVAKQIAKVQSATNSPISTSPRCPPWSGPTSP